MKRKFCHMLILALTTISLLGQSAPLDNNALITSPFTRTGSGQIFGEDVFGGPVVRYSTLDYHYHSLEEQPDKFKSKKNVDKKIHDKRKERLKPKDRIIDLRFHNHTSLSKVQFESEISFQIDALSRDFRIDPWTYGQVLETGDGSPFLLQILRFKDKGGNHSPTGRVWEDWYSFDQQGNGKNEVNIHVVEQLPAEIGHGYARFIWVEDDNTADIVIRRSSFGIGQNEFNEGKVLTHLMANHFGLLPLHAAGSCEDDGLTETPIHSIALNFCSNDIQPTSQCDNQVMLMNNYMSHTPDACKSRFTPTQWRRMLQTLELISEEN